MARYSCSSPCCQGLPLRLVRRRHGRHRCGRCGERVQRRHRLPRGPLLAVGVVLAGLTMTALPDLLDRAALLAVQLEPLPPLLERFMPARNARQRPRDLVASGLVNQLAEGDRQWLPTVEPLPDGGTRYLYQRRPGDPDLSVAQLQALINNPPTYDAERASILALLTTLDRAGVRIVMDPPHKSGAAGEWDHNWGTLRIQPLVVAKGTVEFAKVLNHEAIHVAQSCSAGSIAARPEPLGLPQEMAPSVAEQMRDPLYRNVSEAEKTMEREAYANQHQRDLGRALVARHCRLTQ